MSADGRTGAPGEYRRMQHVLSSAGADIRVFHLFEIVNYDPSDKGPIEGIPMSRMSH